MFASKVVGSVFLAAVLLFSCTAAQTIPVDQVDGCVSVNDPNNVTYTCTSDSSMTVLWQVATRQLRNTAEFEADGIFVTDSVDRLTSSILFTTEGRLFVTTLVGSPAFVVTCQTVRNVIDVVEGDIRTIFVYYTPPPPVDLTISPTSVALRYILEWQRPLGEPDCVPINYQVNVTNLNTNSIERERVGVSGDISRDRESLPYDVDSERCQLYEFSIISLNDAGSSASASITEIIPISPNIGPISSSLTATPVLDDGVQIDVFFEPATSCNSTAYPVVNYIISISGLAGNVYVPHTGGSVSTNLATSDFPGLVDDAYTVNVMACAAFACHLAQPVSVVTSDVQSANITFFSTTVSLFCEFAETGTGSGCRFQLSLPDGTSETLDLARPSAGDVVSQQCATTQNRREAYLDIVVVALDGDGQQRSSSFQVRPDVTETTDEAAIRPCEPPIPCSPVKLIDAELIEVDLGDRLTLNCSSSSYYATEFLEIGQQYTIDEKLIYLIPQHGNPAVSYVPTGCQHSVQDIECCRVLEITVVQLMDRRSYLCRATEKQGDQAVYYSDRSYLLTVAGIAVTISVLAALPLGILIGCCGVWCVKRWGKKHQQLQEATYEEPGAAGTAIHLSDNLAYGHVNRQRGN